jgi:hypothetical protein
LKQIIEFKTKQNLPISLTLEDIMLLINYTWDDNFGNIATIENAIAVKGWNTLHRNLLFDLEISNTTINNNVSFKAT